MAAVATLALLAVAPASFAEPAAQDRVAAEALFRSALVLADAGEYAVACPKFEAALTLYPSASTMVHVARCHERDGKLATAWSDYHRALVLNRDTAGAERQKLLADIAQKGIDALEARMPKLHVTVAQPPAGLRVTRDGIELPLAALDEDLPVDPGVHRIEITAPGHQPEVRTISALAGRTTLVEVTLIAAPTGDVSKGAPAPKGAPIWAWAVGGAGLALLGAGAAFLVDDLSAIAALRDHCRTIGGITRCDEGYDYAADNARKNRGLALAIAFGSAGAIALGVGVAGVVTSTRPAARAVTVRAAPWVTAGSAGIVVGGRF